MSSSTKVDYLAELVKAARWFSSTLAVNDSRNVVPTCPGWTIYDLGVHLGNIHGWAATIVETGAVAAEQNDEPAQRRPRALADWYRGKSGDLIEVLRMANPDRPCWNFAFGQGVTGFWHRRQLHETVVHSFDLAFATLDYFELEPWVAADGIDEVLRVLLHRMRMRGHAAELTAPLSIIASDVGQSWTVRPGRLDAVPTQQAAAEVVDGTSFGADLIEGDAEQIYRLLWKRQPPAGSLVRFSGDIARIQAFLGSRLTP